MCVVFSKTPPLTNLSSLIAASPSPQQLFWDFSPDNDGFDQKTTNDGDFCVDFPPLRLKWRKAQVREENESKRFCHTAEYSWRKGQV